MHNTELIFTLLAAVFGVVWIVLNTVRFAIWATRKLSSRRWDRIANAGAPFAELGEQIVSHDQRLSTVEQQNEKLATMLNKAFTELSALRDFVEISVGTQRGTVTRLNRRVEDVSARLDDITLALEEQEDVPESESDAISV